MPGPMADWRQVHRRDVRGAQLVKRRVELALERHHEVAARPHGRALRALATYKDDRGCKGVGTLRDRPSCAFCLNGPRAVIENPARMMAESIVSQPVDAVDSTSFLVSVSLCLKA